jgi:DNA polymerase-4
MERKIIHLNIADFGVAVERILDSSLRTRPLILAQAAARAVVYDMSEEAYQDGVRKGMRLTAASRYCRQARILPPRPQRYQEALQHCVRHAQSFTPLTEVSSGNGHLYLDVTGTHRLHGSAPDVGWRLRKTLRSDMGLDPIWSVAPNKLVAKVASRLVKPVGEYIVAEGEEEDFLAPLPLSLLPGVGHGDLERLRECNIIRVAQAAALALPDLHVLCGRRSRFLYQAVRGIDQAPVQPPATAHNNMLFEHYFADDSNREEVVRAALRDLVRRAAYALSYSKRGCCNVAVFLHYTDGMKVSRQVGGKVAVNDDQGLEQMALTALYRAWYRRVRLRRISLICSRLVIPARQLSLFGAEDGLRQKQQKAADAMNKVRALYGEKTLLQRGAGVLAVPVTTQ